VEKHGNDIIYPASQYVGSLTGFFFPDKRAPDIDNALKAAFDGINGLAWEDDSQIIVAHACKHFGGCAGMGLWVVPGTDTCSICRQICRQILEGCPWADAARKKR